MRTIQSLESQSQELAAHGAYRRLESIEAIRVFMEAHVFAVWDFMSLLKSLQRTIADCAVPWRPSAYPREAVRFINQIVLDEESDLDAAGNPCSHFELYLESMREVGASTAAIRRYLASGDLDDVPPVARPFVAHNLRVARTGSPEEVAGAFLYGRERLVPRMFTSILAVLDASEAACPSFRYYLERHVALDGGEHGPIAEKVLDALCEGDETKRERAIRAAREALAARGALWDAVAEDIDRRCALGEAALASAE